MSSFHSAISFFVYATVSRSLASTCLYLRSFSNTPDIAVRRLAFLNISTTYLKSAFVSARSKSPDAYFLQKAFSLPATAAALSSV